MNLQDLNKEQAIQEPEEDQQVNENEMLAKINGTPFNVKAFAEALGEFSESESLTRLKQSRPGLFSSDIELERKEQNGVTKFSKNGDVQSLTVDQKLTQVKDSRRGVKPGYIGGGTRIKEKVVFDSRKGYEHNAQLLIDKGLYDHVLNNDLSKIDQVKRKYYELISK